MARSRSADDGPPGASRGFTEAGTPGEGRVGLLRSGLTGMETPGGATVPGGMSPGHARELLANAQRGGSLHSVTRPLSSQRSLWMRRTVERPLGVASYGASAENQSPEVRKVLQVRVAGTRLSVPWS